jgi:hypothetical protein
MIAAMLDLAEIDRELELLGPPPQDWTALVERTLGPDRSPERIDALLATLGVAPEPLPVEPAPPRRPSSHPPRALGRHARWTPRLSSVPKSDPRPAPSSRSTLIGQPSLPPATTSSAPTEAQPSDVSRDTTRDTSPDMWGDRTAPQAVLAEPFPLAEQTLSQRASVAESDAPELGYGEDEDVTEPAVVAHFTTSGTPVATAVPAVDAHSTETGPETAAERRVHIEALLDQDLDPRDFPSVPPTSSPASAPVHATDRATNEDEFELLVEEEEILELDDVDLVEDES